MKLIKYALLLSLASGTIVQAQTESKKLTDMSLEELMNMPVSVASKTAMNLRETPGIVTVITREDIENTGVRDLAEALTLLVPGFQFSADVEGTLGPTVRGIYSVEGKVLVLVDGVEMNERVFGTSIFGNHYLLSNVERIEVVRGPGSVIYGGFGEMAVINMITRDGTMNGGYVAGSAAQSSKKMIRNETAVGYGKTGEDWKASLTAQYSKSSRSDREQSDFYGNTQDVTDKSEANSYTVNGNLKYRDLDVRLITERYDVTYADIGWAPNLVQTPPRESFDAYYLSSKYNWKISDSFVLTPTLEYKEEKPYVADIPEVAYTNHKKVTKSLANITGLLTLSEGTTLLTGVEYWETLLTRTATDETFKNGTNELKGSNSSAFAELTLSRDWGNVIAGARYDSTDGIGSSLVPRVGYTKKFNGYNVKLFASQGYRTPGGIIINRSMTTPLVIDGKVIDPKDIGPEKATIYEGEFGWQINPNLTWTTNAYIGRIDNMIVYIVDPVTGFGYYNNYDSIGTGGLETNLRFQSGDWNGGLNYAYYELINNAINAFDVPGQSKSSLGAANHRLNIYGGYKFNDDYSVHPSLSYFGERYYVYPPSGTTTDLNKAVKKVDPIALANINFRMHNLGHENLELDLGVTNLFDSEFDYLPSYYWAGAANVSPRPTTGRAVTAKVSYGF